MILKALNSRWGYALTAFIWGTATPLMLDFIQGSDNGYRNLGVDKNFALIVGLTAAIAATLCWPSRSKRTSVRMGIAGLLTVILTLCLIGIIILHGEPELHKPQLALVYLMLFLIGASLLTTGIPYIIGICASMLFVDRSIIKTDDS